MTLVELHHKFLEQIHVKPVVLIVQLVMELLLMIVHLVQQTNIQLNLLSLLHVMLVMVHA